VNARVGELGSRLFGFHPGVAIQVAAVIIVAIGVSLALAIDPTALATPAFGVALTIFGIATVVAFLIGRSASKLLFIVPVLDMLALIVMRQIPDNDIQAISFLAILPALWMGWSGRLPLAALAVVLSLGMIEIPGINDSSTPDLELALRNLLTPAVVLVAAGSTYVASRRTEASIRSLVEQEKTTAAALEREKSTSQLLDGIVSTIDIGILAYDTQGSQILANPTIQKHPVILSTGRTPLALEQQGFLLHTDRVTPIAADEGFIRRALNGHEYSNRIIWIGAPGTRQHALSASARPLTGPNGEFAGTVIAIDDVTAYLEAISAKDAFVSSISHEFRTPLASIVGYLELILDDPAVTDGTRSSLEVIERNADRLRHLVNDLLVEASKERGTVNLEREWSDVATLCATVVDKCSAAATAAGVRLVVEAPQPAMAVIDQRRIAQAIEGLLANGLRFTPSGGTISLTVSTDGDRIRVVVVNSGADVSPDELKLLASPHARTTETGEQFTGLGLGLTVSRSIVEAHAGTLTFSSIPGSGTMVTVSLPVR
jgi:two-component system phosphate regulon sensor histidine kinase PhoR